MCQISEKKLGNRYDSPLCRGIEAANRLKLDSDGKENQHFLHCDIQLTGIKGKTMELPFWIVIVSIRCPHISPRIANCQGKQSGIPRKRSGSLRHQSYLVIVTDWYGDTICTLLFNHDYFKWWLYCIKKIFNHIGVIRDVLALAQCSRVSGE